MSESDLFTSSFRKIAALKPDIKTYAYNTGEWIELAVDDYDFYCNNEQFKELKKEIRNDFLDNFGIKIVFVYRASPENVLEDLKKRLRNKNIEMITG